MMDMTPETTSILDAAEAQIRDGGYGAINFEQIAEISGLTADQIQTHFRDIEYLATRVSERYRVRFIGALGAVEAAPAADQLAKLVAMVRFALVEEDKMCLCGMFGAQIAILPPMVAEEIRHFFHQVLDWVTDVFRQTDVENPRKRARETVATLEGAMIMARTLEEVQAFDDAAEAVLRS